MKKLTIEHLAPYLPYELKIILDEDLKELDKYKPYQFILMGLGEDSAIINNDSYWLNEVKPILHPLSDLTKEISEGKPKYFPMSITMEYIKSNKDLLDLPYNEVNYLIRNHFDVFGLIKEGLAIDINTIK